MKGIIISILIIAAITGITIYLNNSSTHESTKEKCCLSCTKKNQVKYYSIAENDNCGECCLNPKVFWLFKLFEKNLTLAEDKTCESLGYSEFVVTETHGVFPLKATIDRYKKPEK